MSTISWEVIKWQNSILAKMHAGYNHPIWQFNGDLENPTFSPSLLYPDRRCHLFLRNGKIEFLSDCTHEFAGKTVDLPDI